MMIRNVLGSLVALVGAAAAVFSPFRTWYDGRHGSAYRIQDLFNGISDSRPDAGGSILIPFAFAALLVLIGVLLRSRLLVLLAGLVTIGFTVLWMVRVGMAQHSLTISGTGSGLGTGVAIALAGGVLMLLGAALMSGRRPRRERVGRTDGSAAVHPAPYDSGGSSYPPPHEGGSEGYPPPYEGEGEGYPPAHGRGGEGYPPAHGRGGEADTIGFSSSDLPSELTAPDEPGATRSPRPGTWEQRQ